MPRDEYLNLSRRGFCEGLFSLSMLGPMGGKWNQAEVWDANGQAARRAEIYSLHQKSVGPLFDDAGRWIGKSTPPIGRERLWNCLSLLSNPATRDKANAIIARTFAERASYLFPFAIFEHSASAQLLAKNSDDLRICLKT